MSTIFFEMERLAWAQAAHETDLAATVRDPERSRSHLARASTIIDRASSSSENYLILREAVR